jgi:hypothetical protein
MLLDANCMVRLHHSLELENMHGWKVIKINACSALGNKEEVADFSAGVL